MASQQSFPGENEVECPEGTVWDITIREPGDPGEPISLPEGTIICLIEGLGVHDAFLILPSGATVEDSVTTARVDADGDCSSVGFIAQLAEVTSGTPPAPLEMGSPLCAGITFP
jgi:hypothetical protein